MKKLIASLLVLVFLVACLYTVEVSPCWSGNLAKCSDDDPNEPEPESVLSGNIANYLDDDPNEPEPESILIGSLVNHLDDDPNEPEPESILTW